jgi:hypothetical protein
MTGVVLLMTTTLDFWKTSLMVVQLSLGFGLVGDNGPKGFFTKKIKIITRRQAVIIDLL